MRIHTNVQIKLPILNTRSSIKKRAKKNSEKHCKHNTKKPSVEEKLEMMLNKTIGFETKRKNQSFRKSN